MKKLLITLVIFLCFHPGSPSDHQQIKVKPIIVEKQDPDPVLKLEQIYHRIDSAKNLLHEKAN